MCNMDYGNQGGFCESCPGNTDSACVNAQFNQQLGTDECRNVCIDQEGEYGYNIFIVCQKFSKIFFCSQKYI